jgi:hypothetical protein
VGVRTPEDSGVGHARKLNVRGVNCLAGDFFNAIDAMRIGSYNRKGFIRCHLDDTEENSRLAFDRRGTTSYLRILGLSFSGK